MSVTFISYRPGDADYTTHTLHALEGASQSGQTQVVEVITINGVTYAMVIDANTSATNGQNGWTPVLALYVDGDRTLARVTDWTGGGGTKPATGLFLGANGFVADQAQAISVRGPKGDAGDIAQLADGSIGKAKLSAEVQTSLGKANSALQDLTGVVTAVANGPADKLAELQGLVSGDVEVSLAALMSHDARPSYLTQIRTAIAANAAKVVFVGDSVTENSDCIDTGALDLHGTYRQVFVEMLGEAFPSVAWTFRHFGLSGRNGGQFVNPAYVGQSGTEDQTAGFLRTAALHPNWGEGTGSVVGKSWLDHVKDSAPDMLVVAFGLNPEFDVKIRDHLAAIRTAANSWTKIPSLVFISAMRPDTRWQDQYRAQGIARVYRAWARQLGYSLIDVNRANNILRDGFDEQMSQWRMVGDVFDNRWRPEWVTDSGTVTVTDDFTRTFGPNSFVRIPMGHGIVPKGHDVSIQVEIGAAMNATTGNMRIYCRAESPYTDPLLCPAWLAAQVSSASARIYEAGTGAGAVGGGTEVGTAFTGAFSTGTIVRLDCIGPRMNLYINGVLRNTALQYSNMRGGDILLGAFGGSGAGGLALKKPRIYAREPGLNTPLLSQTELYGVYDGTASRKMPYGGNGLNHPTSIGVTAMYKPGIQGLVRALIE